MKKTIEQHLLEGFARKLTDITEDWQKANKRDKTDGMSQKAVNAYRRENPGSKLKTAVTTKPSKLKKGSKASKRRKSFCARMSGNKGPMKKPNGKPTPKALALRRWNCESIEEMAQMIAEGEQMIAEIKKGAKDSNGVSKCWPGYEVNGTKKVKNGPVRNCVKKESVAEGSLNETSSDEAWELVGQPVPEIQQFVKQMGYGNDEQSIAKITSIIDRVPATQIPAASIPKLKNLANKGNDAQTLKSILQISGRPDAEQQYTKLMQARDAGEGRNRDVSGYIQYVKSGNYDPPVLLKLPTGLYVVGGRTRLYAALALGVPANVKIISANNFKQGVAEGNEPEGSTFKNSLHTIIRVATHLEKQMGDSENFPEWESEMIGSVKDQMVKIMDYEISKKEQQGVAEVYTPSPAKPLRNPPGFNKQGTGVGNKLAQLNRKEWEEKKKKEQGVAEGTLEEKWTQKYKSSINCSHPKGFSQKAHCAGKKKK